ncbi:DUF4352 domain-containing protein [Herbidospora galbida]|uniref:DUF4352 domain-containing protein n=1 Tax=Herbidospora galbida TaxID=2575442 RepID=A0A4U3ME86_9ACTN|nr:DUF4352 domain-containing protein [Herbidospora galbida]TKK87525.1 DUF4352 domain-containing protein [Herbidospora galbida]
MYNNHPQPYPQTVIVQKKGGGCLKAVLVGAAVLMGLTVVGAIVNGGAEPEGAGTATMADPAAEGPAEETEADAEPEEPKTAGIGDTVRDGDFAFKVTKVEKGLAQVGEGFLVSEAQGQYVLIHVTVKNIGTESQMFSDSSQKLVDKKGRQFDADSGAAALGLKNSNSFLNSINPGNSVKGILLFDVPRNITLKSVELHDSIFSDGVEVSLTK